MTARYAATKTDRPTYPDIKSEYGEDPARFLASEDLALAFARIRGITDLELLTEWQRVEAENWSRPRVMKRLNARKRALATESPADTPEATQTAGGSA